ncbi:MAG TPA: SurA N-terminal domain-containing protein [Bacillales bacterium]
MLRKLLTLGLMMILAVTVAACGGNEGNSAESPQGDSQKTQEAGDKQADVKTKGVVDPEKTVAVVNGEKIKGKQYNPLLKQFERMGGLAKGNKGGKDVYKQAKKHALDAVIGQTLILQDAEKKGYKPSDKKLNKQMDQIKEQLGGEKKLKQTLKKQDVTMAQLKGNIADQLQWSQYVKEEVGSVKVSKEEIESFYEKYKDGAKKPQKLEKIKPVIKEQLQKQKKQQKIAEIIDQLKKQSDIEIKI